MPGIQFLCPSCQAVLRGPAHIAAGTSVRCNKCNKAFRYGEKPAEPAPSQIVSKPKPKPARPAHDDGGRDEAPREREPRRPRPASKPARRAKPKSSNLGLIIGLSVGGGVIALLLIVGVVVIGIAMSRPAAPPVAAGPVAPSFVVAPGPTMAPAPPVDAPPPPVVAPALAAPAGNGALAADVLDKVKKATVYVRVVGSEGLASGSGFFEAASGEVLTNAHVLGMLNAGDPPPQRIDVVLESGERDEKSLPARIVTVDRISDLAVLAVDARSAGLIAEPAGLTVASAAALRETQEVFVFGFPFGESLGKNITVRTSSVASLRKDKDGVLARVQVNGGMDPGNSGGPVVDALGQVVGVAVSGIRNTQINFAIPGDTVQAVFRGRCSEISVGEAFRKGDQIAVPVDIGTIDPMHRVGQFAIDWWPGDPAESVPPSHAPASSALRQTTALAYQPETMTGHVDLILASLPAPGQVLWVQPNFVDGSGQSVWSGGMPVTLAPPLDVRPATLSLRPQAGKTRLSLKSKATLQLSSSDGEKHTLLSNIETRLIEDSRLIDARGTAAAIREGVEHFEIGVAIDGKGPPPTPRMQHIVQDVGKLGMSLTVDGKGNLTQKEIDLRAVPPSSQDALLGMGGQILQSLDTAAVPVPGGMVQPGQSWQAVRDVPIDTVDSFLAAAADMTYTFRGVRTVNGKDFGVVEMRGVVRPMAGRATDLAGQMHGTAAIDLAAGRVSQVHAFVDVIVDVRFLDESLRSDGKLEVTLTRGAP